jgi:hypothetical protein
MTINVPATSVETMMKNARETIKQRIQIDFVSLIPDDVFQAMVDAEIKEFTTDVKTLYNNEVKPSPLRKMIQSIIEEKFRLQLKEELEKSEYVTQWNCHKNQNDPSVAVNRIIRENMDLIIQQAFGNVIQEAVFKMRQTLSQNNSCY